MTLPKDVQHERPVLDQVPRSGSSSPPVAPARKAPVELAHSGGEAIGLELDQEVVVVRDQAPVEDDPSPANRHAVYELQVLRKVIVVREDGLPEVSSRHDVVEAGRVDVARRGHDDHRRGGIPPCHRLWTTCCRLFELGLTTKMVSNRPGRRGYLEVGCSAASATRASKSARSSPASGCQRTPRVKRRAG